MTDDVFIFGVDDPITCPWCGLRCDVNEEKRTAKCVKCGIFHWEIEEEEEADE